MSPRAMSRNKRGEKVNKVVDKVLNHILGHEAAQIIYDYLENNYSIQRNEIVKKLDSFNHALEECLGTGAMAIEKAITENLELQRLEENRDFDFVDLHLHRIAKLA